jgi:ribonuclease PH
VAVPPTTTTTGSARHDGRAADALRPVKIELGVNRHAEGSCLIEMGNTHVWVTASVEDRVPGHRRGTGHGWITAEYSMLPRATRDRNQREAIQGRIGGRTHEIQRLIGRSLRAGVDMAQVGERTITLDCDVLQADGGTRTASITGGFVALYMALRRMKEARVIAQLPVRRFIAAVSCGIVDGEPRLDLDYSEDFLAGTDLNCVLADDGRLIELQATAEHEPYSRAELDSMLDLAAKGIKELVVHQKRALATLG